MDKMTFFLKAGSALAGATTTALLPNTGLVSTVIGGAAGTVIDGVLGDVIDRAMSKRETERVSACSSFVIENIRQRILNGDSVRDDDFFRVKTGARPKAEEFFEGVLLKAKLQFEEIKIQLLANLYSSACFDATLTYSLISFFMQMLDRLTFEHLVTLKEFVKLGDNSAWQDNDLAYFYSKSPDVGIHIQELKSLSMLSDGFFGDAQLMATKIGHKFIKSIDFKDNIELFSVHVVSENAADIPRKN